MYNKRSRRGTKTGDELHTELQRALWTVWYWTLFNDHPKTGVAGPPPPDEKWPRLFGHGLSVDDALRGVGSPEEIVVGRVGGYFVC